MAPLNAYLAQHYLTQEQLALAAAISKDELDELIERRLVPQPSYVVSETGKLSSFVFGDMDAPGATSGRYFHPSSVSWLALARATASVTEQQLKEQLKFFSINS